MTDAALGMVGLATMGRNLALNVLDHGFSVAGWNLEPELSARAVAESGGRLRAARTLEELVGALERPRRIVVLVKAGRPVDIVCEGLAQLLEPGDVVVDGGNSFYEDTRRRQAALAQRGIHLLGLGVSGGAEGARHGPSLMPGGDPAAWERLRPILEAVAARTDQGPCVAYVGPEAAGHFVKMVHNGIEYALMQLLAEAHHLLRAVLGLDGLAQAPVFARWNEGPLGSFLVEVTAKVLGRAEGGTSLVDQVLDQAEQKGTGLWTARVGLDLGVPTPTLAAGVTARVLSSQRAERLRASQRLAGPGSAPPAPEAYLGLLHDALLAASALAYAEGLNVIRAASSAWGWGVDLAEVCRIWRGGCIIRARLLDLLRAAYRRDPALPHLLLDPDLGAAVGEAQAGWRAVVADAAGRGVPTLAFGAALAHFDSYRSARLPQGLTQAQRDAFGAHGYRRLDDPEGPPRNTEWLA